MSFVGRCRRSVTTDVRLIAFRVAASVPNSAASRSCASSARAGATPRSPRSPRPTHRAAPRSPRRAAPTRQAPPQAAHTATQAAHAAPLRRRAHQTPHHHRHHQLKITHHTEGHLTSYPKPTTDLARSTIGRRPPRYSPNSSRQMLPPAEFALPRPHLRVNTPSFVGASGLSCSPAAPGYHQPPLPAEWLSRVLVIFPVSTRIGILRRQISAVCAGMCRAQELSHLLDRRN